MEPIGWTDLLRAEAVALLACAAGFVTRGLLMRGRAQAAPRADGAVFLFDGDTLIDASADARSLLAALGVDGLQIRARLTSYLADHLPDIAHHLASLDRVGRLTLTAPNGMILHADLRGGITRIALDGDGPGQDLMTQTAQAEELARLRRIVQDTPVALWQEASGGEVAWANPAYMQAAGPDAPRWPLPHLFPMAEEAELQDGWRAVSRNGTCGTAWPLDRAKRAEEQLRDFRKTLTGTFADLPIGIAIFDRNRLLQVFNPALMDLTGLPSHMLSPRPSLFAVLDALRDRQMIPEPKDYHGWRRQMIEIEEAAAHGRFEETWNLPGGRTWRVVGRPHPDGAMALMFEDISADVTRTRRFRAELELGQAVIDAMEEAVAVFAPSGILVISNAAYVQLWGDDPGTTLADEGIATLCARWRAATAPTTFWAEVEAFASTLGPRTATMGAVRLLDGRTVDCRLSGLPGGATLVGFQLRTARPAVAKAG